MSGGRFDPTDVPRSQVSSWLPMCARSHTSGDISGSAADQVVLVDRFGEQGALPGSVSSSDVGAQLGGHFVQVG